MKKQLLIPVLLSLATPLLASNTITILNASRCGCTLKNGQVQCKPNATVLPFYVGTLETINQQTYFKKTSGPINLGQTVKAPITHDDGKAAIAYNSDGRRGYYEPFNLNNYPTRTGGLTMVWQYDQTSRILAPILSRCIEPNSCQYLNNQSICQSQLALR